MCECKLCLKERVFLKWANGSNYGKLVFHYKLTNAFIQKVTII
jgi:hypothetical protein